MYSMKCHSRKRPLPDVTDGTDSTATLTQYPLTIGLFSLLRFHQVLWTRKDSLRRSTICGLGRFSAALSRSQPAFAALREHLVIVHDTQGSAARVSNPNTSHCPKTWTPTWRLCVTCNSNRSGRSRRTSKTTPDLGKPLRPPRPRVAGPVFELVNELAFSWRLPTPMIGGIVGSVSREAVDVHVC